MNKLLTLVVLGLTLCTGSTKAQNEVNIGKQNIKVENRRMTPEALWAMVHI